MAENEPNTARVAVINLECELPAMKLKIGGSVPSAEVAIAVLEQALREYKRREGAVWEQARLTRVVEANLAWFQRRPE